LDGQTVNGYTRFDSRAPRNSLPPIRILATDWRGVDVRSESRKAAAARGTGISIHEHLEQFLKTQPKRRRHRWILLNDGAREIADYLVIDMDDWQHADLSLWHAKAATGATSAVRVDDIQVVVQQAIKSRRYITDSGFWTVLGNRLAGSDRPSAVLVEGSRRILDVLCGNSKPHKSWSIAQRAPHLAGHIGIAQPGLSWSALATDLAQQTPTIAARQVREFLTVWHDAAAQVADIALLVDA
jgi:hypothetical protein